MQATHTRRRTSFFAVCRHGRYSRKLTRWSPSLLPPLPLLQEAALPPSSLSHVQQPPPSFAGPNCLEGPSTGAAAAAAGGSSLSSSPRDVGSTCCLDQFHSMRPDNPVQQLPLLGITHTSSAVRVAAWLLDTAAPAAAAAANDALGCLAARGGCAVADAAASVDGCDSMDGGGSESAAGLLAELEGSVSGSIPSLGPQAEAQAEAAAARPRAEAGGRCGSGQGFRASPGYNASTRRRSLEAFMSAPIRVRVRAAST